MIKKPEEMDFSDQKFSMIIYGSPGIGKTTLALSSPSPILLDFDRGISRVRAEHRKDTSVCKAYEEALADVNSPEMANYETVVIDTGGSFITFLKDWAFRTQSGAKTKNGDFNSLKGFGFVKSEFASFTELIKTTLRKNVIYVFHTIESQDKDGNPIQRLMCEGSPKNTVWTPCDFGGYVQMVGGRRIISFTPEQEFFAKGCHGITGKFDIPTLSDGDQNDFVTRLFEQAKKNIKHENDIFAPKKEAYEKVMILVDEIIESVVDTDSANTAFRALQGLEHALTSKKESSAKLRAKAKALGLKYSASSGGFVSEEA